MSRSKHGETCCDTLTQTEVEQRLNKQQETCHNARIRYEQQDARSFLKFRADEAIEKGTSPSAGKPVATHTHYTCPIVPKKRDFLKLRADEAVEGEQKCLSRLSEAEFHTVLLLEDRRNLILSKAKSEIILQESRAQRAANAIQNLNRQNSFSAYGNLPSKSGI